MTRDVATASLQWTLAELERALTEKRVSGFRSHRQSRWHPHAKAWKS